MITWGLLTYDETEGAVMSPIACLMWRRRTAKEKMRAGQSLSYSPYPDVLLSVPRHALLLKRCLDRRRRAHFEAPIWFALGHKILDAPLRALGPLDLFIAVLIHKVNVRPHVVEIRTLIVTHAFGNEAARIGIETRSSRARNLEAEELQSGAEL